MYVEVHPDWNDIDWFIATVFYEEFDEIEEETDRTEIARIDNKAHGHTHFNKLFERGNPKEPFDGTVYDAWNYLKQNWKKYARRYANQ